MQWNSDLPADWDDAPANPPETDAPEVEIVGVEDGYVMRPTDQPDEGSVGSNSVFCSAVENLEEGELTKWQQATEEFDD